MSARAAAGGRKPGTAIAGCAAAAVGEHAVGVGASGGDLDARGVGGVDRAAGAAVAAIAPAPERQVRIAAVSTPAADAADLEADLIRRRHDRRVRVGDSGSVLTPAARLRRHEQRAVPAVAAAVTDGDDSHAAGAADDDGRSDRARSAAPEQLRLQRRVEEPRRQRGSRPTRRRRIQLHGVRRGIAADDRETKGRSVAVVDDLTDGLDQERIAVSRSHEGGRACGRRPGRIDEQRTDRGRQTCDRIRDGVAHLRCRRRWRRRGRLRPPHCLQREEQRPDRQRPSDESNAVVAGSNRHS